MEKHVSATREERREALVAPWEVEEVKEGSLADPES